MEKKILKLKKVLEECGIDYKNLAYIPEVPMLGIREVVIEERLGMKVIRIISSED